MSDKTKLEKLLDGLDTATDQELLMTIAGATLTATQLMKTVIAQLGRLIDLSERRDS